MSVELSFGEKPSLVDGLLLRMARRPPPSRGTVALSWIVAGAGALPLWWKARDAWSVDRGEAEAWAMCLIALLLLALVAEAFHRSLRLLARSGAVDRVAHPAGAPAPRGVREPARAAAPEVRLARASAQLSRMEQVRWLLPLFAAGQIAASVGALAWFDIPRPLDLVIAATAGMAAVIPIAHAAVRRWVRLVVALQETSATAR